MIRQLVYHARFWEEERVRRLLPVVNPSPNDFEAPFCFKLDDANVQLLIQYNSCRGARIGGRDDLGNALVQGSLQNGLG